MIWDVLTQEEKNKIILKLLVHLSKVDEGINEHEFAYLIYVCKNLDLNPELIREYAKPDIQLNEIMPTDENDRMAILYHLLFTMNADSMIDVKEEERMYAFAFKLGFSEDMTRDFIKLMKEHSLDDLPQESMLNIIRKYNN